MANFTSPFWRLNTVGTRLVRASFKTDRRTERIYTVGRSKVEYEYIFLQGFVPAIAVVPINYSRPPLLSDRGQLLAIPIGILFCQLSRPCM